VCEAVVVVAVEGKLFCSCFDGFIVFGAVMVDNSAIFHKFICLIAFE